MLYLGVCKDSRVNLPRWVDLLLSGSNLLEGSKSTGQLEAVSQHTYWCKRMVSNPINTYLLFSQTVFWQFLASDFAPPMCNRVSATTQGWTVMIKT